MSEFNANFAECMAAFLEGKPTGEAPEAKAKERQPQRLVDVFHAALRGTGQTKTKDVSASPWDTIAETIQTLKRLGVW